MSNTTGLRNCIVALLLLLSGPQLRAQDDFGLEPEFDSKSSSDKSSSSSGGGDKEFSDLEKELDDFESSSGGGKSKKSETAKGPVETAKPEAKAAAPVAEPKPMDAQQNEKALDDELKAFDEKPKDDKVKDAKALPANPPPAVEPAAPAVEEPAVPPVVSEPEAEPPPPAETNPPPVVSKPKPREEPPTDLGQMAITPPPDFDEPDVGFENRLYDIYVKHFRERTPDEQWMALVGERQVEQYTIQSGDTLWGISQTFFGDGHYWPKVWSLNDTITNPHLIEPGNVIRFLLGNEGEAPAFAVTEGEQGAPPAAHAGAEIEKEQKAFIKKAEKFAHESAQVEQAEEQFEVEIPPPRRQPTPVLTKIPPSFPEWGREGVIQRFDDVGIEYGRRPILDVRDMIIVDSYIQDRVPAGIGKVVEPEVQDNLIGQFNYIFVEFGSNRVNIGESLVVVKDEGLLKRANDEVDKIVYDAGYRVEVQAQIQIVADEGTSYDGRHLYKAMVTQLVSPVTPGAVVIEGKIDKAEVSMKGPKAEVATQIIGGKDDRKRQIFSLRSLVFLNRGNMDGIQIGQILPVYNNRKVRNLHTVVKHGQLIGHLKVVKTFNRFATAVVVEVRDEIRTGDITGTGGLVPRTAEATPDVEPPPDEPVPAGSDENDFSDDLGDSAPQGNKDSASAAPTGEDSLGEDTGGGDDFGEGF